MKQFNIIPLELKQANAFVSEHHRHHKPCVGHKYSIGLVKQGRVVGVAIAGRPVARRLDDRKIIEVYRCCTDGTYNACSALYGACARIARNLGYQQIQTYILDTETGTSLKASGWYLSHSTDASTGWNRKKRVRKTFKTSTIDKHCWKADLNENDLDYNQIYQAFEIVNSDQEQINLGGLK